MITLDNLVRATDARYAFVAGGAPRSLVGVWPAVGEDPPDGWRQVLAVVSEYDVTHGRALGRREIGELARKGAVGLAICGAPTADLLSAAKLLSLPVLICEQTSGPGLAQAVSTLLETQARQLEDLVDQAQQLSSEDSTSTGVVQWLAQAVGGRAALVAPHQPPPVFEDGPELPTDQVMAIMRGASRSAAIVEGPWSLRMYGLGGETPRSVLVVAKTDPWAAYDRDSIVKAEGLLSSWLALRSVGDAVLARSYAAVLQMLIAGQTVAARRAACPLTVSPGVLTADQVRVYVVDTESDHRSVLAAALRYELGDDGLVVPNLSVESRMIVIAVADDFAGRVIQRLLSGPDVRSTGVSLTAPLEDVGQAYEQAVRALASARSSSEQYAVFSPEISLSEILPERAARRWASDLLAPLENWSSKRRSEYLETTRLSLKFGGKGTASILNEQGRGITRNTVRERTSAVWKALGLDRGQLADGIRLDLALELHRTQIPVGVLSDSVPRLTDLFHEDVVLAWARDYMNHFSQDGVLLGTLVTWLNCGQDTVITAQRLGLAVQTVRARLKRAEAVLRKPLVSPPDPERHANSDSGLTGHHELALAAYIAGYLSADLPLDG